MGKTPPVSRAGTVQIAGRRLGAAPSVIAWVLGAMGLALVAACVALTCLTLDPQASRDGVAAVFIVGCGLLGLLVARHQPRNPEGWLLLSLALCGMLVFDSGLYAVLDYRMHHGTLPLGAAAVFIKDMAGAPLITTFPLIILLFPDGRLTRRWAWVLWSYVAVLMVIAAGSAAGEAGAFAGQHIRVDITGMYSGTGSPAGGYAALAVLAGIGLAAAVPFWLAFVARQVLGWRGATGERRQQLKWLMSGAAIALVGVTLVAAGPPTDRLSGRIVRDLAFLALSALPVSIGVGILKYHLYGIDRLISRTLSYTLVTGLLVGVYAGLVTLATRVLPLTNSAGVAVATLAVAALFSPLRRRVQRAVDRRFNRARYDAEMTVTEFAGSLSGAVDLDTMRHSLAGAVQQALEPAHVSVWISPGD